MRKTTYQTILEWRDQLFEFWGSFTSFLIYIVSILFAVNVLAKFVMGNPPAWNWQILGISILTCNIVNFILSKEFPKRFYSWNSLFEDRESVKRSLFLPPVSTVLSSAALTIFVLSRFSSPVNAIWQESLTTLDNVYEDAKLILVIPFAPIFFAVLIGGVLGPFFIAKKYLDKPRSKVAKALVFVLFTATVVSWFSFFIFLCGRIEKPVDIFFKKATKYLVSFTPLYWFYILFINSKRI